MSDQTLPIRNDAEAGAPRRGAAREILRAVALAYRRVMRAPQEPAATRAEAARLAQKRQSEALAAATAEYRRLSPWAIGDKLAVSGEVNRMIAAAINVDPQWFWHGPDAISGSCTCVPLNTGKHLECYTI